MTFDELANGLPSAITEGIGVGLVQSGPTLVAVQLDRIHAKSKDTAGNEIKNTKRKNPGTGYSEEAYFTLLNRFTNVGGIPDENVSSTRRSVQLPEGYKSFREYNGRQTREIDLDFTGLLRQSYIAEPNDKGFQTGYIGGEGGQGINAAQKMKFAEDRNGSPIIHASKDELNLIVATVEDALNNRLNQGLI